MNNRIIIIGLGGAGARHLRLARGKLPEPTTEIVRSNAGRSVPDLADGALASLEDVIDFVPTIGVIATHATAHADALAVLLPLGTHLLVEMPLAARVKEGEPC